MLKIGNMVWRIGRLLEVDRQIAWTRDAGFDGVGLHASAGAAGQWRGVEPSTCSPDGRARLREQLAQFAFTEVHAPFAIELQSVELAAGIAALVPVLDFARDVRASIVTVHAQVARADEWLQSMRELDAHAARAEVTIALEIVSGFEAVAEWDLPRIGVNLDVGHMVLQAPEAVAHFGGMRGLIGHLGPKLVHLHLHDVASGADHLEIGTGEIDFAEIAAGLADIGYEGTATIEMNPDRVSPAGMRRSLRALRTLTEGT